MKNHILLFALFGMLFLSCNQEKIENSASFTEYLTQLKTENQGLKIDFSLKLDPEKCKQDLIILKSVLEEAHTPIYRYYSKEFIDVIFDLSINSIDSNITYKAMIKRIARIQNTIACGHSNWSHSNDFLKYRKKNQRIIPLDIEWVNNKFYVKRNLSMNGDFIDGAEIISINNSPIIEVIRELKRHMYRDGQSADNSYRDQEASFSMAYSNFMDVPETSFILIRQYDNYRSVGLPSLLKPRVDSVRITEYPESIKKFDNALEFEKIEERNLALLTINSFNKNELKNYHQNFESYIDSVFNILNENKIENLMIDLRDNTGGWTAYGKYLFEYFIEDEVDYVTSVITNKYSDYSFSSIITNNPWNNDTFRLEATSDGKYEWTNYPSLVAKPKINPYHGKIWIVTNNLTRSCAAVFSSMMREHTNARFVGEETGTAHCGPSGMIMNIELPYTKISYSFSTAQYNLAVKNSSNSLGVIPEINQNPNQSVENLIAWINMK